MNLHVETVQPHSETAVLAVSGRLVMGPECRELERAIDEAIKHGAKHVVVDLAQLEGIDSTGAGILVVCHGKMQKAHGSLRIAGAQGIVQETLVMIHVDRLVQFYPTAQEASQSLAASQAGK